MKSWRPSKSDLVALCVLLTTVLSLAVVIGGRDKGVRLTRGGAHRLDSAEVVHDHSAIDFTLDIPTTPLLHVAAAPPTPLGQAPGSSHTAAVVTDAVRVVPPVVDAADAPVAGTTSLVRRTLRPSPGRAPPVI